VVYSIKTKKKVETKSEVLSTYRIVWTATAEREINNDISGKEDVILEDEIYFILVYIYIYRGYRTWMSNRIDVTILV